LNLARGTHLARYFQRQQPGPAAEVGHPPTSPQRHRLQHSRTLLHDVGSQVDPLDAARLLVVEHAGHG
jgi:hypothetical protein